MIDQFISFHKPNKKTKNETIVRRRFYLVKFKTAGE